ncbi:4'-phosphopantetheinyl transferase family protein [Novilysobacter erysipheiresistens]|uniref:4'-phosphopantetheinyl transferase family protein n=1 Tax=Novilysobacter erysipheiresistens TaxID=1749332 RepID=UPI003CE53364
MRLAATVTADPCWTWLPLPPDASAEPLARAWMARLLDCAADALPIGRDRHGRPWLDEPFSDWDGNWSHSGAGLLVALGHRQRVGIDLEWQRPRPRALELARRFFTGAEADALAGLAAPQRERAFLRLWCAKEAVLKAHGHGLAFGLDRLAFAGVDTDADAALRLVACDPALGRPSEWNLRELAPAPGYLGALAWRDLKCQRHDGPLPGPAAGENAPAGDNSRP